MGRPREEPVGWVLGCGHGSCQDASSRKHHPRGNRAEHGTPSLRARVGGPHGTRLPRRHRCQTPGGWEAMQCQGSGDSAQHSSSQVPVKVLTSFFRARQTGRCFWERQKWRRRARAVIAPSHITAHH